MHVFAVKCCPLKHSGWGIKLTFNICFSFLGVNPYKRKKMAENTENGNNGTSEPTELEAKIIRQVEVTQHSES
mgnify:CR=1 FL=1